MSGKKAVANGDLSDTPAAFSPPTFARHAAAVARVESRVRTRAPRPNTGRFPGLAPGAWGLLASGDTVTAATGKTLGTGTVKLCDSTGTVYPEDESVDVLNAGAEISASAGDRLLPLEWVLGDWTVCGAGGGCTTTICVTGCGAAVKDAVVTIKSGSTVIDSGTTDVTGCVTLTIPSAGSYTVVVSATCFQTHTSTETLACGGSITIGLTIASGCICGDCCPGVGIPGTLFLTDSLGTTTLTPGTVSYPVAVDGFVGSNRFTRSDVIRLTTMGLGASCLVGSGPFCVVYEVSCAGGYWWVARYWLEGHEDTDPIAYYLRAGCPDDCGAGVPPGYGGPATVFRIPSASATCSPISISSSDADLTDSYTNGPGDPGGATMVTS